MVERVNKVLQMVAENFELIEQHLAEVQADANTAVFKIAENVTSAMEYQERILRLINQNSEDVNLLQNLVDEASSLLGKDAKVVLDQQSFREDVGTLLNKLEQVSVLLEKANQTSSDLYWQSRQGGTELSTEVNLIKSLRMQARDESELAKSLKSRLEQALAVLAIKEADCESSQCKTFDDMAKNVQEMLSNLKKLTIQGQAEKERLTEVLAMIQFQDVQKQRIDRLLAFMGSQKELIEQFSQQKNSNFSEFEQNYHDAVALYLKEEGGHQKSSDQEVVGLELF